LILLLIRIVILLWCLLILLIRIVVLRRLLILLLIGIAIGIGDPVTVTIVCAGGASLRRGRRRIIA